MTHIAQGLLRVNGDTGENIFVFGNSLATIANGGAGNDYYLYLSGQVTISDFSSNNRLYFGPGITITSADISRSQLHISFEGTDDTLRLSNFSSYRFFTGGDSADPSVPSEFNHTEFIASANSGSGITVTMPIEAPPTSITTPASEPTIEIRANGTIDADIFSLGYDLRAELNGGAGRDTFVITPYQTEDVLIRDFSVGNLIRFETDVGIANVEINRGTFEISLENDAMISVMIGSLQNYQLEEGTVMNADDFITTLAPTSIMLADEITTLVENMDTSDAITVATINTVSYQDLIIGGLELSGDDEDIALFEFNEARTELLLKAGSIIDFEANPSLDVTVFSVLNPDVSANTLQISVTNVAPMITSGQSFTVSEATGNDVVVGTVANVGDMNSVTFNITIGNIGGVFVINQDTGVITVANSDQLDFETIANYTLTVTVSDDVTGGTADSTETVTVTVTDENDAPVLGDRSFTVSPSAMDDDLVGIVVATDADMPADTLSYRIIDGGTALDGLFAIDSSGAITIADNNNLGDAGGFHTLNIEVSDSEGETDTATITVQVRVLIALADLQTNNNGIVLIGASAGDTSGSSVSGAGDVNGDGLDDIIIGARNAYGPNGEYSGESYVVFGKTNGGLVQLSDIADANENDDAGFVLNGANERDRSGGSVSGAGDVNGDGLADVIVGAHLADPNEVNASGAGYVVFGKTDGGVIELSDIAGDDDDGGFVLSGANTEDRSGYSVSAAGDVNGDGLDDLIIGAFFASPNGSRSGASYVVFGKTDGGVVQLSTIADAGENDNAGFVLNGVSGGEGIFGGDRSGRAVSGAGDVNGDGLDDIIIGASRADSNNVRDSGASYVVFGKTDGGIVQLSDIANGNDDSGFVLNGANGADRSGVSVSGAGDVNGDGLDDIIVGAVYADPNGENNGASYVVFGKTDGGIVELSMLDSDEGFVLNGIENNDFSGNSVSGAGDINGDGLDDILIGAHRANPNLNNSGSSYLVFGKTDGNTIELTDIVQGIGGFAMNGASRNDNAGYSVSGAGDINGDGFDDLLVSATLVGSGSGASYVIFGGQGISALAIVGDEMANTLTGSSMANQLIGGAGDDTLIGNGGEDVLRGGRGDDILAISNSTISNTDFAVHRWRFRQ